MPLPNGTIEWLKSVASPECLECATPCEEMVSLIEEVESLFPAITNVGLGGC